MGTDTWAQRGMHTTKGRRKNEVLLSLHRKDLPWPSHAFLSCQVHGGKKRDSTEPAPSRLN